MSISLVLVALLTSSASDPPPNTMSLEEALRLARTHQPALRQAEANVSAAEARTGSARAGLLPQVVGRAAYQRGTSNSASSSSVTLPGTSRGSSFDTSNRFSLDLGADWLLFDFGQTLNHWRAARAAAEAQRDTGRVALQRVLANVRTTYFVARATKALLVVAQETLANQQNHLGQIQAFVEVGSRPEIDLAQARADMANARVQLINAQSQYATAKAQLLHAVGLTTPTDFDIADDSMPNVQGEDEAPEMLLEEALAARPELASLAKSIQAQELVVSAARAGWAPSVSASTAISDSGRELDNLAWNWNGGVSLRWPLYQGGLTTAKTQEAEANLSGVQAQLESSRQEIRLELEKARLGVLGAKASLTAAEEAAQNASERLRLAEGRYTTGVGGIIELGDAQLALTSARAQRVQADYNLATARANLLLALGREM